MSVYRTASGKMLDINALKIQQEKTIAVGNAKQNARGDIVGPGGKIIKSRDEIMTEFYNRQKSNQINNPIHTSSEEATAAAAADIFTDIPDKFEEVVESQSNPTVVEATSPAPTTGGISDALAKSQELAERLKSQRNRI